MHRALCMSWYIYSYLTLVDIMLRLVTECLHLFRFICLSDIPNATRSTVKHSITICNIKRDIYTPLRHAVYVIFNHDQIMFAPFPSSINILVCTCKKKGQHLWDTQTYTNFTIVMLFYVCTAGACLWSCVVLNFNVEQVLLKRECALLLKSTTNVTVQEINCFAPSSEQFGISMRDPQCKHSRK